MMASVWRQPHEYWGARRYCRPQKKVLRRVSALPSKADMVQRDRNVRFVPKGDIRGLIR